MKTAILKTGIWLAIVFGITIIVFSWNVNIFNQVNKLIERKNFEAFLNAKVSAIMLNYDGSSNEEELALNNPEMAALQEYLATVDPAIKRVPRERLKEAYLETRSLQKSNLQKSTSNLQWQAVQSDLGGRVRAIMWDPNDPQMKKVWAGAVTGGLWYKNDITNDIENWVPVDDFWSSLSISCITHDPNDPETFYVGTGEAQTALIIYRESSGVGFGIMRSTDAGQTWEFMPGTEQFEYVTDIEVRDENGTSVIYAGVASGVYMGSQHLSGPSDGLYRKAVGSDDWEQVLPNITDLEIPYAISDIEIGADGRLYVGSMPNINGDGGATIFYSDAGTLGSWTINEEYKTLIESTPDFNLPGRVILSAAPSDENRVYVLVAQGYFYGIPGYECHIIARSDNKGESWTMVPKPPDSGSAGNWAFIAWHALTGAVDPNNPDRFYVGGLDVWRSDDAGETWTKKTNWTPIGTPTYVHADHHRMLFQNGSSEKAIFATDGGIYYSDSLSISSPSFSEKNQGFSTLQVYKCAIGPDPEFEFGLGGHQDNGTVYFDGNPINNNNRVTGGDGGACFVDKNEPDVFITSSQNNYFYIFGNFQYVTGVNNWMSGNFISSVDYDYKLNTLYANAVTITNNLPDQIVRISGIPYGPYDGGFLNMSTGSTVPFTSVKYSQYSMLGLANLYLGTQSGRLFRVTNANNVPEVTEIDDGLFPTASISCIALGGSEDTLLVTFSNYGVSSVWQSYDGGENWAEKEGNLPDIPVRWALYHPYSAKHAMLATEIGVWTSDNLDENDVVWQPDNSGLANVRVDMLQLREADNTVLAGTHGRGFFKTTFEYNPSTVISTTKNRCFTLYPNPTKGIVNLNSSEFTNHTLKINIYSISGSLTMSKKSTLNNSTAQINISELSKGTYFIQIETNDNYIVKKIIKH